ncbi:hypothetical protein PRNP1_001183 [Phytophthora ramorum]
MITTHDVDPIESKMLRTKIQVHAQQACTDASDYDCSQKMDEESRKELVRRGAVGRRCAVVALPTDVLAAIAQLKW